MTEPRLTPEAQAALDAVRGHRGDRSGKDPEERTAIDAVREQNQSAFRTTTGHKDFEVILAALENLDARLKALEARALEPPETERNVNWQPIETAPRDGRNVLGAFPRPSHQATNRHFCEVAETWWMGDKWAYPLDVQPSHWMPMPPSPWGRL